MTPDLVVATVSAFLSAISVFQGERVYRANKSSREYEDAVATFRTNFRQTRDTLQFELAIRHEASVLVSLLPLATIERFGDRINNCITAFDNAIDPRSRTPLRDAESNLAECVCTNLKLLKRTNGSIPPGRLRDFWKQYDCGPISW